MGFRFIDRAKKEFPAHRLGKILGVSQSGYFAWKDRPARRRQREDRVMLAHVRSVYVLSHETYGNPRMKPELQDSGFAIDLFSHRVVGWAVGDRVYRERVIHSLRKAIVMQRPKPGLIHHSDRGSQYCYDHAMVETFFNTLKSKLIWRAIYQTRKKAEIAIVLYIEGFYNLTGRHSAVDYLERFPG